MFTGIGIDETQAGISNAMKMLTNKDFVGKIHTNLSNKFLAFLNQQQAFSGNVTFRQKFLRQSADKNFATISKSVYPSDVWLESMTIPKSESKIQYTPYEIEKGKNSSAPSKTDKSRTTTSADKNAAKALFGAPVAPVAPAAPASQPVPAAPPVNGGGPVAQAQSQAQAQAPTIDAAQLAAAQIVAGGAPSQAPDLGIN